MLQAFGQRIRAQKQRWVLILDPPIHIKKGYYPYDSGIKNNVFMQDISGKPYVGQVSLPNNRARGAMEPCSLRVRPYGTA